MPVIAIVGAGPGLGLAIARAFGTQGFNVALVSRSPKKLMTGSTGAAYDSGRLPRHGATATSGYLLSWRLHWPGLSRPMT